MQFQAFKFSFLVVAFAIPSKYGAFANKKAADPASSSISSRCPRSEYLTDIISCIAAEAKSEAGDNPGHANRLENLEKEVANLKAQLANAGKPLPTDGPLPQNLLLRGYDKYTAYDLAWQSLHMAAAAACRGSTVSGGSGPSANTVRVRNIPGKKNCAQICRETGHYRHCDAEVSIYGKKGKATRNGQDVGKFYNHGCGASWGNGGNEASVSDEAILNHRGIYFSFCCCRKP